MRFIFDLWSHDDVVKHSAGLFSSGYCRQAQCLVTVVLAARADRWSLNNGWLPVCRNSTKPFSVGCHWCNDFKTRKTQERGGDETGEHRLR